MSFEKILGITPAEPTTAETILAQALQSSGNFNSQMITAEASKAVAGLESFTPDTSSQARSAMTSMRAAINTAVASARAQLSSLHGGQEQALRMLGMTPAQESIAAAAGVLALDPRAALASKSHEERGALKFQDVPNLTVIGNVGLESTDARRTSEGRLSLEAFDNKENRNAVMHTVQYNLRAARQDDFGEAFFPTVLVNPSDVGYLVQIRLNYLYDSLTRNVSGALADFKRRNVLQALVDPTLLDTDMTRVIPVYRTGTNASSQNFSARVNPRTILADGESVKTAPLAFGKKFDIMGLSQRDRLVAAGLMDQTDALDTSIVLERVYIHLPACGDAVLSFLVADLPGTNFNAAPQGNTRNMSIMADLPGLHVTAGRIDANGNPVVQLDALGTSSVRLSVNVYGMQNLQDGSTLLNSGDVVVSSVTADNGQRLDLTTGQGKAIADLFAGARADSYDLREYFTNSNRRQRGRLTDTQTKASLYTVPLLPPFTAQRPIGETDANDNGQIDSLVQLTRAKASIGAVAKLHETFALLKEHLSRNDAIGETPVIFGVSSELVVPTVLDEEIDLSRVDSLTSSDRADDVTAMLLTKIRDMAFRMFAQSQMKNALDSQYEGAAPKPTLIVGADQYVFRYLTQVGDTRAVSEFMDMRPVMTTNKTMDGLIYLAFGLEVAYTSGAPTAMHFGNMAWRPEAVLAMPLQRQGAITHEMTVSPSFRHIVNVPVLARLKVKGIEDIIADKATLKVNPV